MVAYETKAIRVKKQRKLNNVRNVNRALIRDLFLLPPQVQIERQQLIMVWKVMDSFVLRANWWMSRNYKEYLNVLFHLRFPLSPVIVISCRRLQPFRRIQTVILSFSMSRMTSLFETVNQREKQGWGRETWGFVLFGCHPFVVCPKAIVFHQWKYKDQFRELCSSIASNVSSGIWTLEIDYRHRMQSQKSIDDSWIIIKCLKLKVKCCDAYLSAFTGSELLQYELVECLCFGRRIGSFF